MNTAGVVPSIRSAWESVLHDRCAAAAAAALASVKETLQPADAAPPDAGGWADRAVEAVADGVRAFEAAAGGGGAAVAAVRARLLDDL
eukprot:scaffold19933_cov39-Isochrysis_galbana.AAC.1